ncbi:hypothetical protein LTR70_009183 [Exophiala xenobiotica]|uniref:Uncharacterized protein n=1 Tax=Lithohypha guttulata TaxID=1690604 RepID=A0ABR0JYQ7_9EURO|nr:hypothetical protein LTR24_008962 [Lithohypha guttulata]KAK5310856.1 hypothetical protein LTR70_009183 [Exophiala xenobiotica]
MPSQWPDYSVQDFDIDFSWLNTKEFFGTYLGFYNNLPPDMTVQIQPFNLNQLVRRIQSSICSMAEDAQTPFVKLLHHDEETIDTFLDETLVVCAAYVNRTKHNITALNRTIARKYIKLMHTLSDYMSLDVMLHALQATILFEIMLLFDEDASMRNLAGHHFTTIEAAMKDLQQRLSEELAYPTLYPGDDSTSRYSRWLMLENIRRLVIAHWIVKAAYTHLRDGYCTLVPVLVRLPLTRSGDLWTASTEDEWRLKTQEEQSKVAVVPYIEALDYWVTNDCNNMDEFQIMLFEACKTMPTTAEWRTNSSKVRNETY